LDNAIDNSFYKINKFKLMKAEIDTINKTIIVKSSFLLDDLMAFIQKFQIWDYTITVEKEYIQIPTYTPTHFSPCTPTIVPYVYCDTNSTSRITGTANSTSDHFSTPDSSKTVNTNNTNSSTI
jgi:hypothetical protein